MPQTLYTESDPDPNVAYTVYVNRQRRVRIFKDGKFSFDITVNNGKDWKSPELTEELKTKWLDALSRQKVAINVILEGL